MYLNRDLNTRQYEVIWAGGLGGSASMHQFDSRCNCVIAWLPSSFTGLYSLESRRTGSVLFFCADLLKVALRVAVLCLPLPAGAQTRVYLSKATGALRWPVACAAFLVLVDLVVSSVGRYLSGKH